MLSVARGPGRTVFNPADCGCAAIFWTPREGPPASPLCKVLLSDWGASGECRIALIFPSSSPVKNRGIFWMVKNQLESRNRTPGRFRVNIGLRKRPESADERQLEIAAWTLGPRHS